MKGYGLFAVLATLLGLFLYLVVTKDRIPHVMPKPGHATVAEDAGADGAALAAADAGGGDSAAKAAQAEAPVSALGRPLRVAVLGWEHVSPGFGSDGGAPSMRGQAVDVVVAEGMAAVESRLAKGGADPGGADIAVLPLPSFVASYEKLRALDPRIFLVTSWSTGREELRGGKDATLSRPMDGDVKLVTAGGDSATLLALFALDRAGTPPSRVKLVPAGSADVKTISLAAALRGDTVEGDRKLLVNTAEARRLVPIVAVAPAASLEAGPAVYKTWSQAWLDGADRARADAPGAARQIAAIQGAPEAITLLERWGQLDRVSVDENLARFGVRAGSRGTVEALFDRTWSLFRGAGMLSSPPPPKGPLSTAVVSALGGPTAEAADAGAAAASKPGAGAPILVHREPESADAASVASEAAFLADVFERATVRVTAKADKGAKAVVEAASDKFPALAGRISTGTGAPASGGYALEVLASP